ncbi:MAG TPA: hypothetical protein V6C95_03220 [Coleofasciculaceae cyanobacterium]
MRLPTLKPGTNGIPLILGSACLLVLLNGCTQPTKTAQTCGQIEKAVDVAQQQYDEAVEVLAQQKNESTTKNTALKIQNLGDLQEKAFEICNNPSSTASSDAIAFLGISEE